MIRLHNRRTDNLDNCSVMVQDARSIDEENRVRQSSDFNPVRLLAEKCAAGFETRNGWFMRVEIDHLEIGDTVNQGVMKWPTGDKSRLERWTLNLSLTATGLAEWKPSIEVEWQRGSDSIVVRKFNDSELG